MTVRAAQDDTKEWLEAREIAGDDADIRFYDGPDSEIPAVP